VGTLDKTTIHTQGKAEQSDSEFHHTTQNGAQFKSYDLFIFGLFYFIFSNPD
jgi:hypothetical protein